MRFDDPRDVTRDNRRTDLARVERGDLGVNRPHPRALGVVEHGEIHRARNMILGKFGGGADIDALGKIAQRSDRRSRIGARRRTGRQGRAHFRCSNAESAGHTLARMRRCAAAVG